MLLGFKDQFIPFVRDGSKTHTIRAIRKIRPKVGETCHCYGKVRQPGMFLVHRAPCAKVESIVIWQDGSMFIGPMVEVAEGYDNRSDVIYRPERFDLVRLDALEKNALAWRDGFRNPEGADTSFNMMMRFWIVNNTLPFFGDIIHWNYAARALK